MTIKVKADIWREANGWRHGRNAAAAVLDGDGEGGQNVAVKTVNVS